MIEISLENKHFFPLQNREDKLNKAIKRRIFKNGQGTQVKIFKPTRKQRNKRMRYYNFFLAKRFKRTMIPVFGEGVAHLAHTYSAGQRLN